MTWQLWDHNGIGYGSAVTGYLTGVGQGGVIGSHRFITMQGVPPAMAYPVAGGLVHGVSMDSNNPHSCWLATQGMPVAVQLGEAVSSGAQLETDASGHAVNLGSGLAVARALEAGAAGQNIFVVFER